MANDIRQAAAKAHVEADLVAEVEKLLERFEKSFDLQLHLERERTLINGRADAVYNRLVIEYEPPRSLRDRNTHGANKHAIGQVQQYLAALQRLDRHRPERLAGVVLDGSYFIFIRYRDERWRVDDPVPVNGETTVTFLRYLLALSTELAITPENLIRDFGENSNVARRLVPTLYSALAAISSPRVQALFDEWRREFSAVTGYGPQSRLDVDLLARSYGVRQPSADIGRLLFALHTYYASFIKLLAVQVVHYYLMPKLGTGLGKVAGFDSDRLKQYMTDLERGGIFAQFGIRNLVEGDFFGWYLSAWEDQVAQAFGHLVGTLANYSLVTLDVDPDETRDLLKHLYQDLMPRELRHSLGEYYTPDWLAERLLNQLNYKGDPKKRLLDPACGSGTFLVLAIRRVRQYAAEHMLRESDVLEQVLANIVGYDLNPLAVISSRTNYLLALGDLLPHRQGDVHIPVYLADSVLTPSQGRDLTTWQGYAVRTAVGRFTAPRTLIDAQYIDRLADLLEESIKSALPSAVFRQLLLRAFPLDETRDAGEVDVAVQLYEQMQELEQRGINGIWARLIKNAFAPLFQGRFHYVAGNPPWVNWESLPADYRTETKPLWVHHNLFPHSGMDTILGKGKKDISMLMTFVAMDDYLTDDGMLGFIITQSVFKTAGAGQGFRRFRLGSGTPVEVVAVDDLVEVAPFEGASNRTAVVIMRRGRETRYPVTYNLWRRAVKGRPVSEKATLKEATTLSRVSQFVAQPVEAADPTSPWITGRRPALRAIQKVLGQSTYVGHAGVCTWLNGVFWLERLGRRPDGLLVVSNLVEGGKLEVESVRTAIEPALLYPLLRGGDIKRWGASSEAFILMVQDPVTRRGYDEKWLSTEYPKTYAYLKTFETPLRKRSGYRRYFRDDDAFYSVLNVGEYTFAPYKVVWPNIGSRMAAAVVGSRDGKVIVPQHIVTLVPFADPNEAHYVCAAVNSSPFNFAVQSYSQRGGKSFGTPSILTNIRIPPFDVSSKTHLRSVELSQQAHDAVTAADPARVKRLDAELDDLAQEIWGLTADEMKAIRESLRDLESRPRVTDETAESTSDASTTATDSLAEVTVVGDD